MTSILKDPWPRRGRTSTGSPYRGRTGSLMSGSSARFAASPRARAWQSSQTRAPSPAARSIDFPPINPVRGQFFGGGTQSDRSKNSGSEMSRQPIW